MSGSDVEELKVLELTLHGRLVGHLVGYGNGRNILSFGNEFKEDIHRPTFSLITHPKFSRSQQVLAKPWVRRQRLHPTLSNLLPEGALRELVAQSLKVHVDNEFHILSALGDDLPGALVATPLDPNDVPPKVLAAYAKTKIVKFEERQQNNKFSLAGVQMKFSMKAADGRYTLLQGVRGDWIIKTPSTVHRDVPVNEFSAMTLASIAGVHIPEIKLVTLDKLDNMPAINLPNEKYAFAIKRFDRNGDKRIHMEDFAQVFVKYPHEKYSTASYEQIAKVLYEFSEDGLSDIQQFAQRLLINILLANGDAHLKNWSLIYLDQVTPRLSPAYDILTTSVYIEGEKNYALNLGKTKDWYRVSFDNFQAWAKKSELPWRAIKPHLDQTMTKARDLWPGAIQSLPMNEMHKQQLKTRWENLHSDFRI